ncbi:MAG: CHRD domain-containing protein [Dehalococcoidia bacterium]|nr:CHRD domain-containing protein [Dehalococcoidia bacterium]
MKATRTISVLVALGAMFALFAATVAAHPQNYVAHLSGGEEVPAVDTNAQGQVKLQANHQMTELSYKLIVANIDDVVAAHIHCAPAGQNGDVGVTLFSGGPTSKPGVLAQGTITTPDVGNGCGLEDHR